MSIARRMTAREVIASFLFALAVCGMLAIAACLLLGCAGAPPKPCPVALETQYTAELVEACADAGSMVACRKRPEFAEAQARHQANQLEAGCRVK